jgi:hypothetical protein
MADLQRKMQEIKDIEKNDSQLRSTLKNTGLHGLFPHIVVKCIFKDI